MRNVDGKYVITRLMGQTGAELKGVGETKEEARANLKNEVKKYREALQAGTYLQETGESVRSPGDVYFRANNGSVSLNFDPERKTKVYARPEVAAYIRAGRKGNEPVANPTIKNPSARKS